jgi:hypothetical protein
MKKDSIIERMKDIKFTTEHSLTHEQFRQLIRDKLERLERFERARQVQEERTLQP